MLNKQSQLNKPSCFLNIKIINQTVSKKFITILRNHPPIIITDASSCEEINGFNRITRHRKNRIFSIKATRLKNNNNFI